MYLLRHILFFKIRDLCSTASIFFLSTVSPSGLMLFLTDNLDFSVLIVLGIFVVISCLFVICSFLKLFLVCVT